MFSDGVSSLKVILEERTTAQQQDEREKKIGQDGKRNCYCRISNFGHQISRKNGYNQWQAPREKKILIIRYLQSLKRRIVERILRHSFFVRPVSIFCDPSETFRDQTNTFGNTSHAKRERERMSASTIVTPFIKSPSMRNTHTEYCYLSVPSRALKWTFVCFVCQNNLQAFWPCYFMCTRVCSMLMHKKPVEKIKLQECSSFSAR